VIAVGGAPTGRWRTAQTTTVMSGPVNEPMVRPVLICTTERSIAWAKKIAPLAALSRLGSITVT
jgi:hypothetical protein